jgi:hypothetical protein
MMTAEANPAKGPAKGSAKGSAKRSFSPQQPPIGARRRSSEADMSADSGSAGSGGIFGGGDAISAGDRGIFGGGAAISAGDGDGTDHAVHRRAIIQTWASPNSE